MGQFMCFHRGGRLLDKQGIAPLPDTGTHEGPVIVPTLPLFYDQERLRFVDRFCLVRRPLGSGTRFHCVVKCTSGCSFRLSSSRTPGIKSWEPRSVPDPRARFRGLYSIPIKLASTRPAPVAIKKGCLNTVSRRFS